MNAANSGEKDGLVSTQTTAQIHAAHRLVSQKLPAEVGICSTAIANPKNTATQKPAIHLLI